jgi:signal transduction histidine kinase/CheY-like chemotaxis protein
MCQRAGDIRLGLVEPLFFTRIAMPNPHSPTISRARARPSRTQARGESPREEASVASGAKAGAAPLDELAQVREELRLRTLALESMVTLDEELAAAPDVHALLQLVIDQATNASGAAFGAVLYRGRAVPAAAADRDPSGPGAGGDGGDAFSDPSARAESVGKSATPAGDAGAAPLIAFAGVVPAPQEPFDAARAAAEFDAAWSAAHTLRCPDLGALEGAQGSGGPMHPAEVAGVRSFLAVPVTARDGATVGGLFFAHPDAGRFSARTQRVVEAIAAQAALALDNLRLQDGLRHAAVQRRHLVDAVRRARGESARATYIKEEFLATLSHELRTPLTAILGWAKVLLLNHGDATTRARGLEAIARNANAQADLIETLLDMSRIVSGKVRLELRPTDLSQVVEEALESIRPEAEAKGIALGRALDPEVCFVAGDAVRLRQLLRNLLSNAVKFTPRQGRVDVTLANARDGVELAVSDTGSGIARQFLPHVFDCFRQADASTTRRHGGLGLGLAIVRQLASLHGGSVTAASEGPGRGARFVVHLPCGGAQPARTGEHAARAALTHVATPDRAFCETDLSGLDLMVVDDQTDARELISQLLVECGAAVRQAASAAEAIREFIARTPDVLLSDIGMPERDGYELIREIRRLAPSEGGAVPALALTAFTAPEDAAQALAAGYQGHLPKPVQPHALVAAVARLAGRGGS